MRVSRKTLIDYVKTSLEEVKADGVKGFAEKHYVVQQEKFLDKFESRSGTVQEIFDDSMDRFTPKEQLLTTLGVLGVSAAGVGIMMLTAFSPVGMAVGIAAPVVGLLGGIVTEALNDQHFAGTLGAFHDDYFADVEPGIKCGGFRFAQDSTLYKNRLHASAERIRAKYEAEQSTK